MLGRLQDGRDPRNGRSVATRSRFSPCVTFPLSGRAIIDPLQIFHARERRDLTAAVQFYLGREHVGAHSAAADVAATAEVLDAMLERYEDLPREVAELFEHLKDPNEVDSSGCFSRVDGQIRFAFGKYRGQPLAAVATSSPDYLHWMLGLDFFEDTKSVVYEALSRTPSRVLIRR